MANVKVSILCIVYNHVKFIRHALDGLVMQKTNFPFEVIVHDDASTDGTTDIIREYEQKYPDIIKPIYQTENQWQRGVKIGQKFIFPRIRGKYVTMNEADDYYIDENKLQKQVDFLDSHPECSMCFHPVKVIWDDNREPEKIFPSADYIWHKKILTLQDLLKHNFIQTNSVMYRWYDVSTEWPKCSILPADYMLHLLHAQYGKIGFIPDVMSVYRRNAGGIWAGSLETDAWFIKYAVPHLRFYREVENRFHIDYSKLKTDLMYKALRVFLRHKDWKQINCLIDEFPSVLDCCVNVRKYKHQRKILVGVIIILSVVIIGAVIGVII